MRIVWVQKLIDKIRKKPRPRVISRTACFGSGVLSCFKHIDILANYQKNRVDYIMDLMQNPDIKVRAAIIKERLKFDFLDWIIDMQQFNFFNEYAPDLIFMDSYSELVDKRFKNISENWDFCCCYNGIEHDDDFDRKIICLDLIPEENLYELYDKFFANIVKYWGEIPIIFINFPIKFETREKYIKRYQAIKQAIDDLTKKYKNLFSIELEDDMIEQNDDGLVYHMNDKTIYACAKKIKALNIKNLKLVRRR